MANLTVSQLNSVELLGGGVRMPKVRKTLDDYFKESKLEVGQHINGDEAMALGEGNTINGFRFERILFLQMFFFNTFLVLRCGVPCSKPKYCIPCA